jgi:hypothetical protein
MRREEHLLRGVLGVCWISKQKAAQAQNHPPVLGKETPDKHAGRPGIGAAGCR